MQRFLSKYGVAAHLALLAVSPLFLFPYLTAGSVATVVLWLSLFAAIWIVMEPSRRSGEMLHDARVRAAAGFIKDPILWGMLVVIVAVAVRWANSGIGLAYDAERSVWSISSPAAVFLPGCVDGAGYPPFATCVALTVLMLGCRHSLGKSARVSFLLTSSSLAGLAAIAAIVAVFFGHEGAVLAASCPTVTSSFAGACFGLYFLAGVASLSGLYECGWGSLLPLAMLAVGGSAAGLYFFAPAPVVLAFLAAGILTLAVTCAYSALRHDPKTAFKCVAAILIAAPIPVLCALALAPEGMNESRLAFATDGMDALFASGFHEARAALSRMARGAFATHPWIGSGLGSFPLDIRFNATAADWAIIAQGQDNPLSGWWLLAAERGIFGAILLALPLVVLLSSIIRRLVVSLRARAASGAFLPSVGLALFALSVLVAEMFFDGSALRPECLMAIGSFLALAALAFPSRKQD
ncbi:MAG: hypothetical protein J6U17_03070 [Kiritimatiellae bacterium]|nr:hypothetical protein [Kiritimatiellia bacterium]